jgi:hypothetical protein
MILLGFIRLPTQGVVMARTIHPPLERWLAGLSPTERRVMVKLALEDHSPLLDGLLTAIGFEIRADELREQAVLDQFEADARAEVERLAEGATWPNGDPEPPTGPAATFDVATRTWTFDND